MHIVVPQRVILFTFREGITIWAILTESIACLVWDRCFLVAENFLRGPFEHIRNLG
jgi:hypothetical protein